MEMHFMTGEMTSEEVTGKRMEDILRVYLKDRQLKPQMVQWLCTHKCNFKCPHCGTAASEAKPDELTTDEIMRVMDGIGNLGAEKLYLTGGEPILRDDIWQVFKVAKDMGMKVGFVTNGYAVETYRDQIARTEVDSVLVSIDGYGENHDRIRGTPHAYERCIKSLDILQDIGVPTRGVSTVYMKENLADMPSIVEDIYAHGCMLNRVQSIIPEGRAQGKGNSPDEVREMLRMVLRLRRDEGYPIEMDEATGYLGPLEKVVRPYSFFCSCGWATMTVTQNGNVMGCAATDLPELNEGNVRERDIEDIWWNGFKRFREDLYKDLPQTCRECKHLDECRGSCWLHRINDGEFCFLPLAEEVAEEML